MLSVMMCKYLLLNTGVARNSLCCCTNRNNRQFTTTSHLRESSLRRSTIRGLDFLRDGSLSKSLAYTMKERQSLGIHGLLPAVCKTMQEQLEICRVSMARYKDPLNKYLFLNELQDRNEKLFYNFLATDIEAFMPLVYTPIVGLACQKFGLAFKRPRGLFISIHDKGHVIDILNNWPENDVRAIVFTDGERILGLGDLGAYGMGIPIGKLNLYTALAAIKPHKCLPITLDVGTNNKDLITDPLYVGLRQPRVDGQEYYDFLAEFMEGCMARFGQDTLLQFEDFALPHATPLLNIWQNKSCTFNDDIQGTASVAVAGLFAAARITKRKMSENIYLFLGAGSAACGIANLCIMAMEEEGVKRKDAVDRIFLMDVDGLLTTKREAVFPITAKGMERDLPPEKSLEKCVAQYKPTCLIGCSTVGGAFTPEILKLMKKNAERPIIFALSNPTPKAECTAQQAYDNTEGKCVFASGSPFPPVKYGGKEYITGQGNNSYIFPGAALGIISAKSIFVPDIMFLEAAKSLAKRVKESDLELGRIYPPLHEITSVSLDIAVDVANKAYELETEVELKNFDINEDSSLNSLDERGSLPVVHRSQLLARYDDEFLFAETSQSVAMIPVADKIDMGVVLKEVEKSKLYFDSWMFLVQIVTYYFILNPSL